MFPNEVKKVHSFSRGEALLEKLVRSYAETPFFGTKDNTRMVEHLHNV